MRFPAEAAKKAVRAFAAKDDFLDKDFQNGVDVHDVPVTDFHRSRTVFGTRPCHDVSLSICVAAGAEYPSCWYKGLAMTHHRATPAAMYLAAALTNGSTIVTKVCGITGEGAEDMVQPWKSASTLSATVFTNALMCFMLAMAAVAATLPTSMSVVIVFLFAGPHNYVEARYFLTRLPARAGRLRLFFASSVAGVVLLTVSYPLVIRLPLQMQWPQTSIIWTVGVWNSALVGWVCLLIRLRLRHPPRRDWPFAWPIALGVLGLMWIQPVFVPVVLVYLHPLMGFWILDREIGQRRPDWRPGYHRVLVLLPMLLVMVWLVAAIVPHIESVDTTVAGQVKRHAGALWFSEPVGRCLIATHAFLEMLHYGVWMVAVPLASGRVFSPSFQTIPLFRRSSRTARSLRMGLSCLAVAAVVLWVGFWVDYATARDVYFTVATLHVLAEIPFLLRLL